MKYYPRLLLRGNFEIVEIGDEVTAVSVGNEGHDYNGVVLLKNESARFMFEKLQNGITLPELVKACMDEYTDSTEEEVTPQVIAFLDRLREKELLVEDAERGMESE